MSAGRVLVCAPRMPEHDRESGSRRIFHLIEFLQEAGWEVSFLARNASNGERYARDLRRRGVAVYAGNETVNATDEYLPHLDDLIVQGNFGLAILAFWYIAEQYLPTIRRLSPTTRVVVDSVDLHFLRNSRFILRRWADGNSPEALDLNYASEFMREMNTYAAADAVLTVSDKEAELVNDLASNPSLAWSVPDAEDLQPSAIPFKQRRGILFVGNFRHPPNLEAVEFLCQDILPRVDCNVLARHPVFIVGNGLDDVVIKVAKGLPWVRLVGWVPSVLPYLSQACVSVVPLLHGAGTKRKLLQALMLGTPSVSTTTGIEGLGLRDREHVLVADDAATFARRIEEVVEDGGLWFRLSIQGYEYIAATHGRSLAQARLLEVIKRVFAEPPKSARS